MKTCNISINSNRLRHKLITYLTATATVAAITLAASAWLPRANAGGSNGQKDDPSQGAQLLLALYHQAQVAELDQLAANFHGALSYGGNITAMMSLWADDSSISLNGTTHVGKAAVQAFFLAAPYFNNYWVSLAPEYRTVITLQGNMATITTQCVAIDLNATPMVVKSVISVSATCEKVRGKWLFTSMDNTTPAPL